MKITDEQMNHIAKLARLELTDAEREKLSADLGDIIAYVETLNEIDMTDVPPTAHSLEQKDVFQTPGAANPLDVEDVLRNAPACEKNFFEVPRVIEEAT